MSIMRKTISYLLAFCLVAFCVIAEGRGGSTSESTKHTFDQEPVYWYEGEVERKAWMVMDEAAVFPEKGGMDRSLLNNQPDSPATITEETDFVIFLKYQQPFDRGLLLSKLSSLRTLQKVKQVSPVFYTSKKKHPAIRMALTGEIIVQYPPKYTQNQIFVIEKEYGLERLKAFGFSRNAFLYRAGNPLDSVDIANWLNESGEVNYAYPNWLRGRSKRADPDDPHFPKQWHLENSGQSGGTPGQDVNVISVWDTYQGSSDQVVAIVDDGLEIGHEDLSDNVIPGQSWDYVGGDPDPTGGYHGTSCAGVAAARGFNALGVTGAAPLGGLVGHRLLGAGTDSNEADALTRNGDLIDIYSNSWGPYDDAMRLEGPGPLTADALENGATNGRGGLGSIYVWAGGNGYDDDNANYDGYANSRYTIAVGASTNYGDRSYYSEKGANILVNAPSNGGSLGITTTDRTGGLGYSSGNYTGSFGGTSSATPLVSGIIALMLEANPNLTWRDVQHILSETSEQIDPLDADWTTNGAGYHINHKYGFGRIDTQAAINAALAWTTAEPEVVAQSSSSPNLSIPDNDPTGIADTIYIQTDLRIESVEVYFTAADHRRWGDLEITLTSPDGTESVLSEQHYGGSSYTYNNWRFASVRHYGEYSEGDWTLQVRDLLAKKEGTLQNWTLIIYGTGEIGSSPIELITPDDGAVLPDSPPATFQWQTDIPYEFKIEFAPTSAFDTLTIAFPPKNWWMPDTSTDTIPAQKWQKTWDMVRKLEDNNGIVYWRVTGQSSLSTPIDTSETRSFTIAD